MELNIKEERAAKAIAELQDRLIESRRDKKDMYVTFSSRFTTLRSPFTVVWSPSDKEAPHYNC